jgi:hypothetical protein
MGIGLFFQVKKVIYLVNPGFAIFAYLLMGITI